MLSEIKLERREPGLEAAAGQRSEKCPEPDPSVCQRGRAGSAPRWGGQAARSPWPDRDGTERKELATSICRKCRQDPGLFGGGVQLGSLGERVLWETGKAGPGWDT